MILHKALWVCYNKRAIKYLRIGPSQIFAKKSKWQKTFKFTQSKSLFWKTYIFHLFLKLNFKYALTISMISMLLNRKGFERLILPIFMVWQSGSVIWVLRLYKKTTCNKTRKPTTTSYSFPAAVFMRIKWPVDLRRMQPNTCSILMQAVDSKVAHVTEYGDVIFRVVKCLKPPTWIPLFRNCTDWIKMGHLKFHSTHLFFFSLLYEICSCKRDQTCMCTLSPHCEYALNTHHVIVPLPTTLLVTLLTV